MSVHVEALADEVFETAAAHCRAGGECARHPFGEVIAHRQYPDLFFLNLIRDLTAPTWAVTEVERQSRHHLPGARSFRVSTRDLPTRDALGPTLLDHGYSPEHRFGMVQVAEPEVAPNPALVVMPVATAAGWHDVEVLLRAEWASSPRLIVEQVVRFSRWRREKLPQHHFVAYDGRRPIAQAGLFQHRFTGYLHGLSTIPAARRRQATSTLVIRAGLEARALGCERLALLCPTESTLAAYYERLGFRTVGTEYTWMKAR